MRWIFENLVVTLEKIFKVDARYFLKGGFWLSATQGITAALGIITTALLAHHLTENDFGVYRFLIGISIIASAFSLTGIGQAVLQATAKKYYGFYRETLYINLLSNSGVFVTAIIAAIYYLLNSNPTLALGCIGIAALHPFINTIQFVPSFLFGAGRFRDSALAQMIQSLITSVFIISAIFLTTHVIIIFFTYLAGNLIAKIATNIYYKYNNISITPIEIRKKYVSYAKHISIQNIITTLSSKLDVIVIFTQLSAADLAIYSIATVVPERAKGFLKNLSGLLLPKYVRRDDSKSLKKSIQKRSILLFFLLSAASILYIVTAPYLYQVIFPKYPEAVLYSQLAALSFPFLILLVPYTFLKSRMDSTSLYRLTIAGALIESALIVTLTLVSGLMGTILAKILYRCLLMILNYTAMSMYKDK